MESGGFTILSALKERMTWLNANQRVVSENIANADTPDFMAKQLEKQQFAGLVERFSGDSKTGVTPVALKATHPGHIGFSGGDNARISEDRKAVVGPTGNSVVLEEEMIKLAGNQMEYGLAVNLYRKNVAILRAALGNNQ